MMTEMPMMLSMILMVVTSTVHAFVSNGLRAVVTNVVTTVAPAMTTMTIAVIVVQLVDALLVAVMDIGRGTALMGVVTTASTAENLDTWPGSALSPGGLAGTVGVGAGVGARTLVAPRHGAVGLAPHRVALALAPRGETLLRLLPFGKSLFHHSLNPCLME